MYRQNQTNKIKKAISAVIGCASALVIVAELNDISFWWVKALAVVALFATLAWNNLLVNPATGRSIL